MLDHATHVHVLADPSKKPTPSSHHQNPGMFKDVAVTSLLEDEMTV